MIFIRFNTDSSSRHIDCLHKCTIIIKFSFNQNEFVPHFDIIINFVFEFFLAPTHALQNIYMYLH